MSNWPEIFFARHGETDWNKQRRYQGTMDIPLNATGQHQADRMGPLLVELLRDYGHNAAQLPWYSSPLVRSAETMRRIRSAFDVSLPDVIFDDRLREISFGDLEGRLHDEVPEHLSVAPGFRQADYWHHRPPAGENYQDVSDRLELFAATLDGPAVIVAHGGIMRALRKIIEGVDTGEAINWHPPQGVIARFTPGKMELFTAAGLE